MKRGSAYAARGGPPAVPTPLNFRVLVPQAAIPDVVGGSDKRNLRRMSEESGAMVQMFQAPHNAPFGVAAILGTPSTVHTATMMVLESAHITDGTAALLIPNADVAMSLNLENVPAKVAFAPKQLSRDSPDTVVDVQGANLEALSVTILVLCQALGRRVQPEPRASSSSVEGWQQRSVIIPVHVVLLQKLRGHNNVTINDIRRDSQAAIAIGDQTGDEVPVTVSGSEHAVEMAVRCVYEVLGERPPNVRDCAESAMRAKGKEFAGGYF